MMKKLTISNSKGITATFTNYGARLMLLLVPDREGKLGDVVLGFNEPEDYLQAEEKYFGVIIGRYANRIANGNFSINGENYQLAKNNASNSLHGGIKGFHEKIWKVESHRSNAVVMSCISEDGEEGFPGMLSLQVTFTLTEANALRIQYHATTTKPSPINLTHHSYFNLKGRGTVVNNFLTIHADSYTTMNDCHIPIGIYESVENTPFDFRTPKRIGQDIDDSHPQIKLGNGYDHNYVLKKKNSTEMKHAATVYEPDSGRIMEVHTNQPGIQLYTANWLSGNDTGKNGITYHAREAFCLETQHFPDTPNQTHFPSCIIQADEEYNYCCEYRFSTKN